LEALHHAPHGLRQVRITRHERARIRKLLLDDGNLVRFGQLRVVLVHARHAEQRRYGFLMDAAVLANVECGHVEAEDAGASHDAAEKSALYVRPEPALDQAITDELQIGQEVAAAIGPRTVSI